MEESEEETEQEFSELEFAKNLEPFQMSYGRLRLDYKRFKQSEMEYEAAEESVLKIPGLCNKADELTKKDHEHLQEVATLMADYNSATGAGFENEVYRIFKAAFDNVRSKNHEIGKLKEGRDYERWKVCIGPNGFARRDNVQAQEIKSAQDMWKVINEHEWIAAKMHDMNLGKWGDMLTKFAEKVPEGLTKSAATAVPVDGKVLIPNRMSYNNGECPVNAEQVSFSSHTGRIILHYTENPYDDEEDRMMTDTLHTGSVHRYEAQAFVYLQLHEHIPDLVEKTKEKVQPIIDHAKSAINELEKEFGRQLLFKAV